MRDLAVDNIIFTDKNGKSYEIKDIRPIPSYTVLTKINVSGELFFDEIASREEIYGEGKEDLAYKIFDANVRSIIEANFNTTKIKELIIPNL